QPQSGPGQAAGNALPGAGGCYLPTPAGPVHDVARCRRLDTACGPAGWRGPDRGEARPSRILRSLPAGRARRGGAARWPRTGRAGGGRPVPVTQDQGQGAVQGRDPGSQLVTQYWAMYPRASPDGGLLYFATDRYKHVRCCPFDVTMRVVQMPLSGGALKFWTV